MHQLDKVGGGGSVTLDGSMSNSFRGNDQVSSLLASPISPVTIYTSWCYWANIFFMSCEGLYLVIYVVGDLFNALEFHLLDVEQKPIIVCNHTH